MRAKLGKFAKGLVLVVASANAQAITVSGTTVDFTFDDSALGLFGSYSVHGDILELNPVNFSAQAQRGANADLVAGTLPLITITAKGSQRLGDVTVNEQGNYVLLGNGDVHVLGSIVGNGDARNVNETFKSLTGIISSTWSVNEIFDSNGGSTAFVQVDNVLAALTFDDSSIARISKTSVSVGASAVPLPTALWMLGSALIGMMGIARRRLA